jgi:hypothetical protein
MHQNMKLLLRILPLLIMCGAGGCSSESGSNATADGDQGTRATGTPSDAGAGKSSDEGWIDFEEPIGDESEVAVRLTPSQPRAGETVKLEVKAGSVYGRFRGKVWARVGEPSEAWTVKEADGKGWHELSETGGLLMDLKTQEMVPLGTTQELPQEEQPGETNFETELTFPDTGKTAVDLKFLHDYSGAKPIAFQAWQGDVQP